MGKVAVIGMGYSGAIIVERLKHLTPALKIDIYDTTGSFGAGLAYQQDDLSNLVNRPTNLMYLRNRGDFEQWLKIYREKQANAYQPRSVFGKFIEETLKSSLHKHSSIQCYHERVNEMTMQRGRYSLRTVTGERAGYDAVVLATGNAEPTDIYRLTGAQGYVNTPYPTSNLADIRSDGIAVLGNQLSAIDAALAVLDADPDNHVTMLTRSSKIPNYVEHYHPRSLKVLTANNLLQRLQGGSSTLNTVRAMFNEELEVQGIDLNIEELMRDHSQAAGARDALYSVFSSTNLIVPLIWNLLSERERNIFLAKFRGAWRQLRVPIPKENWRRINQHISAARLACRTGLVDVSVTRDRFVARGRDFECSFSYVINATGAGDSMEGTLFKNMAACGMCIPHQYGGIDVHYEDCRVINRHGPSNIFALGAPTTGVFYAVSNIDVLQMQAELIFRNLRTLSI
ncbi:FAD/NAD(P)-binding protein [Pseudomonas sp. R5(2019)]|uniref:FAD/NAD(P)-binding protein n=1 Tax=Pseudomonas sp. R5(2019) TaxID=2697566 RepID=UPI001412EFB2|nr:FAD/NAD(P)-binding protein [Pseudomonas sp. R5(2019)]NBA95039.1 NAD(P)-binding domain-containing protein [Pseudomonas sp. R5(2019)]